MSNKMIPILADAYRNPATRACYYSGNGAVTGSGRLNAMAWDWTPQLSRGVAGSSTCMFPLALGCPRITTSEGKEWVCKLFNDPAQIKDYQPPANVCAGRTGEVLENARQLLASLPPGELLRQCDVQSPLGIAELMWDESFYMALIERPGAVHDLLDKITTFVIAFIRQYAQVAGERLNAAGFPLIWAPSQGTMLSDDTMSLLSPAMHREFSLPYINRIADACGPLFYHSCSWRKAYFANIHQIRNVRTYNWNPGNSDDPAAIIAEFSGQAVLAPHLVQEMHRDNDVLALNKNFADEADLFIYTVRSMRRDTCLSWWLGNIVQKGPVIEKIYDFLHCQGHSPAARGVVA